MKSKKGFAMQVSIDIQDELYEKVVKSGIDMQSKFNKYLQDQLEEDVYLNSTLYQENRAYFQKIHNQIKNGDVELIPFNEDFDALDDYIDNV